MKNEVKSKCEVGLAALSNLDTIIKFEFLYA